jgi:hypothetical protein
LGRSYNGRYTTPAGVNIQKWDIGLKAKSNSGADKRDRTADLRVTNALLYQLSYVGIYPKAAISISDIIIGLDIAERPA